MADDADRRAPWWVALPARDGAIDMVPLGLTSALERYIVENREAIARGVWSKPAGDK